MRRRNIIALAYACEPGEGSEPGTGWAWARLLTSLGDVWVFTRANNRPSIEAVLGSTHERDSLHFVYVDLPAWLRFWKRGQRGIRLYYLLWQIAAVRSARRLASQIDVDVVWHVTLANAWLGSLAPLIGAPFVYGPVGGGVGPSWRSLVGAPKRAVKFELGRAVARSSGRYLNPAARLAWRRADVILVNNRETRDWLPARHRSKARVVPNPVIEADEWLGPQAANGRSQSVAIFAGRLVDWKGAELAIRAVARIPPWQLLVFGQGPERKRLAALIRELRAEDRISLKGHVPRQELLAHMRAASVFLFPSLHDDAAWAVAEALASGLPVLCCDRGGPPAIAGEAGIGVAATTRAATVHRLAEVLAGNRLPSTATAHERARAFTRHSHAEGLRRLFAELELE